MIKITQRQAITALLALQLIAAIVALAVLAALGREPSTQIVIVVSIAIVLAMLAAHLRGWKNIQYANLLILAVMVAGPLIQPATDEIYSAALFLPVALAAAYASPPWVLGVGVSVIAVLLARAGFQGVYARGDQVVVYLVVVLALTIARLVSEQARQEAERNAEAVQVANATVEAKAQEVEAANAALAHDLEAQRRLVDLVATLETPMVPLVEGVLLAPIIGQLNPSRAASLTAKLLRAASEQRARLVILDTAGLADVDTSTAGALVHTAQALRLLGCEVAISGISAEVAMTLTELNVEMAGTTTVRSPQEALSAFLERERPEGRAAPVEPHVAMIR